MNHHGAHKISDALELLNEAAHEKRDELAQVIGDRYSDIKELFAEKASSVGNIMNHSRKQLQKTLREQQQKVYQKAKEIDQGVHRNPWPVVGAVAAASVVLGILIGRRGSRP